MAEPTATEQDIIDKLAESFVARLRAGERPSIEEYAQRYPELADGIRELLPALVMLEQRVSVVESAATKHRAPIKNQTPAEIGDYRIIREIGRGGMGVVYEAMQQSLGRHVALKVLAAPALLNPAHLHRFHLEAKAAARLHHTHIVPVFGVGEHSGLHYYAMQFIDGQSLDAVIDAVRQLRGKIESEQTAPFAGAQTVPTAKSLCSGKPTDAAVDAAVSFGDQRRFSNPADEERSGLSCTGFSARHTGHKFHHSAARIGLQVAEALAYAHSEGILHRDIKPSNLLLDARGNTWITDFGLAKTEGGEGLTQTGDFVGTLRYMAPERLEGWSDRRSDIYGLGATLYELLTLQTLYQGSSRAKLVDQILNEAPAPPKKLDESVPVDLETIILKAMAKEPAERYHTAGEMAEDLRRFLADRPIVARRATPLEQLIRWRRRNPAIAGLTAMVVALLVTTIAVLANSNARARRESAARAITLQGKDTALQTARDAVTQMLNRVGTETYLDVPLSHPLRANLLEDAIKLYDALRAEVGADHDLNRKQAAALQTLAVVQRELGRHADAGRSLERCIRLLQSSLAGDPHPPSVREAIAEAELVLAYTWEYQTVPPSSDDPQVESQYRRTLALYKELERDWPQHRWQYVLVFRYLAGLEGRRQNRDEAQRLWREAIANGEAYLAQHNDDIEARISVCWACAEFFDALIADSPEDRVEASSLVERGLHHAAIVIDQAPQSEAGADVRAALHFRQALCHWRDARPVQALADFQVAIEEIESLCEEFPWNSGYWNSSQSFFREAVNQMRRAGRNDDVLLTVRRYRDWLQKIAANAPHDFFPQEMLAKSRSAAIALLREAGLETEAEEFAESIQR